MEYRVDRKTGNKLSVLGYGGMRFPRTMGKIDESKTEELILYAIKNGVNYFDTAYIYGDSEKVLGNIIKKNNLRDKIFLATKLPLVHIRKKDDFDKYFNMQLSRLQTDFFDYYLMHMITSFEQWQKLLSLGIEKWIKKKQAAGEIKNIGFSFHGAQKDFLKIIETYDFDFCLIQYNYMNENYQAGKVGLINAYKKGMTVMIMEPLLGGKLANSLPTKAVEIFKENNNKLTPAAWALNWLWNQKEITVVLSGMNSLEQLVENIKTATNSKIDMLSSDEKETINRVIEVLNEAYKIPCTSCNYCMPCPRDVNIPAAFSSYNTIFALGRVEGMKQYTMSIAVTSGKKVSISNCTNCGFCEKKCPQKIKVTKELKIVKRKLEPFWLSPFMAIARARFKNKN